MKKTLFWMSFIAIVLLTQTANTHDTAKWTDKDVEKLSRNFFHYSDADGKQSLVSTSEPEADWYGKAFGDPCENTVVKLAAPEAALSIPGASLILAFLQCPAARDFKYDSIVAIFDRHNVKKPLCFSRLELMAQTTDISRYYYGTIETLEARKAGNKGLYVVARLSGGDAGDIWTSFIFLHIDMKCSITMLSKLYSGHHCNDGCEGIKKEYRFIDNKTIEVISKHFTSSDDNVEKVVKRTRKRYRLEEWYNNPGSRIFPSKTEKATALLNTGADIDAKDTDGTTPLMWAAEEGSPSVVKALLNKNADVNAKDDDGRTALMSAAYGGYLEVVKLLLEKGADIKARDKFGRTVLMAAVSGENLQVISAEVKDGVAIPRYGEFGPTLDVIELLIEKGADINEKSNNGSTALIRAARKGHHQIVRLLLEKAADVNAKTTKGSTALMVASKKGHVQVMELLKAHGAKE